MKRRGFLGSLAAVFGLLATTSEAPEPIRVVGSYQYKPIGIEKVWARVAAAAEQWAKEGNLTSPTGIHFGLRLDEAGTLVCHSSRLLGIAEQGSHGKTLKFLDPNTFRA